MIYSGEFTVAGPTGIQTGKCRCSVLTARVAVGPGGRGVAAACRPPTLPRWPRILPLAGNLDGPDQRGRWWTGDSAPKASVASPSQYGDRGGRRAERSSLSPAWWTRSTDSSLALAIVMDSLEDKKDEDYQMYPIEIKDDEEPQIDVHVDQPRFLEPICPEEVNEDTRVYPRVGEEYQVVVPDLVTKEEGFAQRSLPAYDSISFGFDYPVGVGLAIPVTWTQNTRSHIKEEKRGFSGRSSCPSQDEDAIHSSGNVPGNLSHPNICSEHLVTKFTQSKTMGEVLSYYYGEFFRSTVGAQVLVEAVGVGKGKYDLTGFALDPSRNHGILARPEIPIGKACSKLSSGDIIKFLTGDFRLSKARSNDLFWEAVWPRLLARGWHSEQPNGKHAIIFLIPGVRKFSRKRLVKGNHYFDSVSDVLSKVASEPKLLEFGVVNDNNESGVKFENGWIHDSEPDRNTFSDKKPPCSSRKSEPGCSPELMKFTVVDTSLVQGEEPFKVRSLRNLPTDSSHGYMSSPHSGDSGSDSSEEPSDSEDSSYEHMNTVRSTTDVKCVNEEQRHRPPTTDKMDPIPLQNSVFSGTSTLINGHVPIDKDYSTMNNVCCSTAAILPVDVQRVHATTSSTEINFQFDQKINAESQVFLAPLSKKRRLVSCKTEKAAANKNHYWNQVDKPVQHDAQANEAGGKANTFVWGTIPNSSTNITFDVSNKQAYCRQLHNVPPNDGAVIYKEKHQNKHAIDLNVPQMPSDYESAASYSIPAYDNSTQTMSRPLRPSENKEMTDCMDTSSDVLYGELSFNSRRHSSRSRPPTARALEAVACGFLGTKQKGREVNFPSSSRSSRPVRRPRRSTDGALPFPSEGEGSSSHFTDPPMDVNEWHMSNPPYQIHSSPSDKSTDKMSPGLFGADKSTDNKGAHELFGIP
ncbi:hypothetical protein PR202_gb21295 [Eleusine coracana subsp. coracana]|uniref:DUF7650 domain-containing protein n=1 Tax=Eleusine coracana subsp. coracana TaxID=191504 RepID=A0AAV5FAT5_ELECO|nr:hypothetical protein PR202_gb21295 [Eleusine coracana subsp. coracana]